MGHETIEIICKAILEIRRLDLEPHMIYIGNENYLELLGLGEIKLNDYEKGAKNILGLPFSRVYTHWHIDVSARIPL